MDNPGFIVKHRDLNGRKEVYDSFRRAWMLATPEERVRQEVLHFLVRERSYAKGRIMTEVSLRFGNRTLRCDAVYYDDSRHPDTVFEFKAPGIELNEKTMAQAGRYIKIIGPRKLVLSNGLVHYTLILAEMRWIEGLF